MPHTHIHIHDHRVKDQGPPDISTQGSGSTSMGTTTGNTMPGMGTNSVMDSLFGRQETTIRDAGTSEGAKKAALTRGRKFPGYTEFPQKGKAKPRPQPNTQYKGYDTKDDEEIADDWFKTSKKKKSSDAEKPADFGASKAKNYAGGPSMGYSQEGPTKPKKQPEKYQGYDKSSEDCNKDGSKTWDWFDR